MMKGGTKNYNGNENKVAIDQKEGQGRGREKKAGGWGSVGNELG